MIRFEHEVTIRRPVAHVFAFLSDPRNLSIWQEAAVRSVQITPGAARVGTAFEETLKMPWGSVTMTGAVTALETERTWGFEAKSSSLALQATFQLEPVAGGTRVTKRGACAVTGFLRLVEPLMGLDAPRMVKSELLRLKTHLEQGE